MVGFPPGQKICRVLIADDKDDNRTLLFHILGRIGFDVREVVNGEQAVREYEDWHPELILMDTRMPVMDGFNAIKHIRSMAGGDAVKIISVTASAFDEDRQKALEIGADDFLGKPFREEVLLEKIKGLLAIDYVYAGEPAPLKREDEAPDEELGAPSEALPASLMNELHEATLGAELDRMLEVVDRIEKVNAPLARRMKMLIETFDYPKLLEMTAT